MSASLLSLWLQRWYSASKETLFAVPWLCETLDPVTAVQWSTTCSKSWGVWSWTHRFGVQDMAYTLATGYVAASILLSGFYLRISAIKIGFIRALSWVSYTKYAMQAMGRIELLGRVWSPSTCSLNKGSGLLRFHSPAYVQADCIKMLSKFLGVTDTLDGQ